MVDVIQHEILYPYKASGELFSMRNFVFKKDDKDVCCGTPGFYVYRKLNGFYSQCCQHIK